jgi:hypothetical protein
LLKLKAAFLNKDPRAVVGKNQRFAAGADFGKKIEDEITLYEKILGNVTGQPLPAAAETEAGEEITGTARRQTLAVLLMLFDGFAIPGYVTKARVHEFLAFLTGKSKDNFKKLCTNPTGYNEQSTSSRDALMEDLRAVRKIFEDLQDETRAGVIESQIQSMSGYDSIIPSD